MLAQLYYHNIHGLNRSKLSVIDKHLRNSQSIYVIAEHWFSDFNHLTANDHFISSSSFPANPRHTGHQNGGIALLASQSIRQSIQVIKATQYTISFHINDTLYSCVYLPPSLNDYSVAEILNSLPPSGLILGDINVRFGKEMRDTRTWNPSRGVVILSLMSRRGLCQTLPVSGCSGNDHVFSRIPCKWEYQWMQRDKFQSDHGRIEMALDLTLPSNNASIRGETRYAFSSLKEPIIADSVCDLWASQAYPRLAELFSALEVFIMMKQVKERDTLQELIDSVYLSFSLELTHICDTLLPTYDPSKIKNTVDNSVLLDNNPNTAQAIRAFKRSQRSFASSRLIEARDASKSVTLEAWEHYQGIYMSTEDLEAPGINELQLHEDERMSEDRIRNTLHKYSSAKAGGPDGFDTRFLKCLNSQASFAIVLTQLFNLFVCTGVTPTVWNTSKIHLLLKDPQNPFPDKTRPISLTNVLRRIFEKELLSMWLPKDWAKLNNHQAGFRLGWSTISNVLLSDNLSRSGWPVSVFLDLKSAFDRVPHSKLLDKLKTRGCGNRVISLAYSLMMHQCQSILTINGETFPTSIQRKCGVFQGSILSPFFFNVFIDSLAESLNTMVDLRFLALLFADDVVIKARTRAAAQMAVDICWHWAKTHGMAWNIAKCGVMGNSRDLRYTEPQEITLGSEAIPETDIYKYLGLPHGQSGISWKDYCQYLVAKHDGLLKATVVRRKTWSLQTRLTIYKVFIRSALEYCLAPLWTWICRQSRKLRDELKQLLLRTHDNALEWIFDTGQPRQILENVSGLGDFESRVEMLQGSIARHLRDLDQSNPLSAHILLHPISSSPNFILQACKRSSLYDTWRDQPSDPSKRVGWHTWCRRHWMQKQLESGSILPHYVLMRCRANSQMDRFMGQTLDLARQALAWRSNRLFSRSQCPVCHEKFNRAHLLRCNLYQHLDTHAAILGSDSFQRDQATISKNLSTYTNRLDSNDEFHYTILDYYLNNQNYHGFSSVVELLKTILHGKTRPDGQKLLDL